MTCPVCSFETGHYVCSRAPVIKLCEELERKNKALLVALQDMSLKFHERCEHDGYFHNCPFPLCVANKLTIAQAEVRP